MIDKVDLGQDGVASRSQLLALGVADGQIRSAVAAGRWRVLYPGVYATFSGPVPPRAWVWAAVLRAGPGAAAGPRTSLWLAGVDDRAPRRVDVVVPLERRVRRQVSFEVRRRAFLDVAVHPVARPPRLRIEEAVFDACSALDRPEVVSDLVIRSVQRRLTTAERLRATLGRRTRQRWRGLLVEVLEDIDTGVRSSLELRWLRTVVRPHGLPVGVLNKVDDGRWGRALRDVELLEWGLVIELDGQESHPIDEAFRDRRRDNRVTVSGRRTLRYGWREVAGEPCAVATEVVAVLWSLGWPGTPYRCGPRCPIPVAAKG